MISENGASAQYIFSHSSDSRLIRRRQSISGNQYSWPGGVFLLNKTMFLFCDSICAGEQLALPLPETPPPFVVKGDENCDFISYGKWT